MIWQITTIDDDQTIFHIAVKKHLPAKTSTFSTTLLFRIQNQLVLCVVHHLINIILIKSIRAIVTMSQASSSWKWRWQVILPSLTVISALVGAPPPATQLFPIVLKPRYAHFIFTSIIIPLVILTQIRWRDKRADNMYCPSSKRKQLPVSDLRTCASQFTFTFCTT